ncbi:RING finger protein 37 [Cimex lectularius]|uniref:RING finger protein 37 n=1 Tax=Cimex lectularius TaxID=79782 RepID=A0A8I6S3M0_CIMLE|nr:RING finger protein 37 [Cimex lectularius]
MLINFSNEGLTTEIACDRICSDDYDVTNLISLKASERSRGFLAGHFIKPPVLIRLKFICDVNIESVIINSRVGQQKSSGFEVFTARDGCEEVFVGSGLAQGDAVEFHIHGRSDKADSFSFKSSKYLNKIRQLAIRIFRTDGSTLPSLKRLDVWGTVNKITTKEDTERVLQIWKNISDPPRKTVETEKKETPCQKRFRYTKPIPTVEIPEEFIDPITCDLMTIPMTLPSGKVVDALTLEKFYESEKEHGRGQSDPFTGVAFSDSSRPIVATSLKARMDKFLLENSFVPELKNAPRALGKKSEVVPLVSTPGPSQCSGKKRSFEEMLQTCLSGLPSFLENAKVKKLDKNCAKCTSAKLLFKLSCDHLVCRVCLCELKTEKDLICPTCWEKIDLYKINRFHVGTYF